MKRFLLFTFAVFILLYGLERLLSDRQSAQRNLASRLRPFPGSEELTVEEVKSLRISQSQSSTAWIYRFSDDAWHYPAYHNAFAQSDKINPLLESILKSLGTVKSVAAEEASRFGFGSKTSLAIELGDSTGKSRLKLEVGHAVPGRDTGESYMRSADSDTIYHMHGDPYRSLKWNPAAVRPPMIDPFVLPRALNRRAIVIVRFRASKYPLRTLRRVLVEPEESEGRSPLDGPTTEWRGEFESGEQKVYNPSGFAFTNYLSRLKYEDLHDPESPDIYGFSGAKWIILEDEDSVVDTLDVGGKSEQGNVYLRHRTTGQVLSVKAHKADLLFPTQALLITLLEETPYQTAEPTGQFGF